jgi:hypothetical protein
MVTLLALSLALSSPAAAIQPAGVAGHAAITPSAPTGNVRQDGPRVVLEQPSPSWDPIAIQPDSDICYKIRAYVFSNGPNPRLLSETTCGPIAPRAKKIDKSGFMPLDMKVKPDGAPGK